MELAPAVEESDSSDDDNDVGPALSQASANLGLVLSADLSQTQAELRGADGQLIKRIPIPGDRNGMPARVVTATLSSLL